LKARSFKPRRKSNRSNAGLQFAEKLGFVGATVEERPFRAA
jgi:hypothetical protein